jgi:hypothetical protein
MSRNFSFALIGSLAVVAVATSYLYNQARQSGVDIQINEQGISINGN